jgi:hypothetical protein
MAESPEAILLERLFGVRDEFMAAQMSSVETWWETFIGRTPVKYISLVLGLIGAALLWRYPAGYFRHSLGEAALISALLVMLVDPFLKARLLKEAARDIFHYLLGFDQQPEIKERLRAILLGTKLFRKNYNLRYQFTAVEDGMRIQVEYDFELINPTDQTLSFDQVVQFETAERPELEYLSLVSTQEKYHESVKLIPKQDDPLVLEAKKSVKIQPSSRGITYRFGGKWCTTYPKQSWYAQHFGFPTIGVTVTIDGPDSFEVSATPTPLHEGKVWKYEGLFMPGNHFNIRWNPKNSN